MTAEHASKRQSDQEEESNSLFSSIRKNPEERLVSVHGDHPAALINILFLCLTLGHAFYSATFLWA